MTRRDFFAYSAAMTATGTAAAAQAKPHIVFPAEPRKRLSVASYPFRKLLDPKTGTMSLLEFPALVRKKFDIQGIEPLSRHFASTDDAYLAQFRKALATARTHAVNIPVSGIPSFYHPDEAVRHQAVEDSVHWLDVAIKIGSPSVRLHIAGVKGVQPNVELASATLSRITEAAVQKNVVVNLENDDPKSEDPFFIDRALNKVDSPYLRALPDFCNSMLNGNNPDFNSKALTTLFAKAYNISHAKDSEVNGAQIYRVDMAQIFAIARKANYRGYFSMEWEGDGEPFAGTQRLLDASLRALA